MKKPKITVLMAVYNGEKYLHQAIESILNQTFKDFEFLIINDGSTDKTAKILQSYHDPRIKIINNEKNIGLTASLNMGIDMSKSEYITRMDADDISLSTRFDKQINYMEENKDIALLGTFAHVIDENGSIIGGMYKPTDDMDIKKTLKRVNPLVHGSIMMRRESLFSVGKYDPLFKKAQDYELWLRISNKYHIANLHEYLYERRIHEDSIEARYRKEQLLYCILGLIKNANSEVDALADELINIILTANFYHKYTLANLLSFISRLFSNSVNKEDIYKVFYHKKFKKYIDDFKNKKKNFQQTKKILEKIMEKI